MIAQNNIVHKRIMVGTLMISVAALPFSVKLCHAAIIAFLCSWIFEGGWQTKLTIIRHSLLLQLIIALILLQTIGLIFSENISKGWFSLEKKFFFLLLPIAFATTALKLNRRELGLILGSFVVACFAGTIVCIVDAWLEAGHVTSGSSSVNQYLAGSSYSDLHKGVSEKWLLFSYVSLAQGIGIHPTYLSLYLAFSVTLLLHEFSPKLSSLKKAGILALVLYATLFIVFLASRIMILGLSMIFLFVLARCLVNKQKSFAFLAIIIAFIFSSLVFLNPVTQYRSLEEVKLSTFEIAPGTHYTTAAQIRASLWWIAIQSVQHMNPIVGVGTGDVEKVMATTSDRLKITNAIESLDPHNQFLYTLLENGIPSLLVLMLILAFPMWWSWAQRDYLLVAFTVVFCLVCLTESALELQKGIVFYSLVSGLLFFHVRSFQNVSMNLKTLLRVGE